MPALTVRGAAAGAVGVVAMDAVTWTLYRREGRARLLRERRARVDGKDTAHAVVRRAASLVGSDAGSSQPNGGGVAVHYALGMGPGAAYAHLVERWPWLRSGRGALYGAVLFALNDEIAAPLLGVASGPRRYPWQAHARGLVGHVVLGVVTDAVLRGMQERPRG